MKCGEAEVLRRNAILCGDRSMQGVIEKSARLRGKQISLRKFLMLDGRAKVLCPIVVPKKAEKKQGVLMLVMEALGLGSK
jgi:hypothetical protein